MGDANASIPTPQPVLPRPMFGAAPAARGRDLGALRRAAALEDGLADRLAVRRRLVPVRDVRARRQGRHAAQRRAAADRGGPGHLHRARSTARCRGGPGRRTAHGPAILPVLDDAGSSAAAPARRRPAAAGGHVHSGGVEEAVAGGLVRRSRRHAGRVSARRGSAPRDWWRRRSPPRRTGRPARVARVAERETDARTPSARAAARASRAPGARAAAAGAARVWPRRAIAARLARGRPPAGRVGVVAAAAGLTPARPRCRSRTPP